MPTLIAYAGLFTWSFLAATLLPLSSEAPLALLVRSQDKIVLPVLVATIGNYLGACTTYWLGRRGAQALNKGESKAREDSKAARLLKRYGQPALLLSWVPVIGDAMVALAGAMRVPFDSFSVWVTLGKAARYAAVAWAASAV